MGTVSMCVLIVFIRIWCSSCGVCWVVVKFVWLCMHIIDVRDVSTCL